MDKKPVNKKPDTEDSDSLFDILAELNGGPSTARDDEPPSSPPRPSRAESLRHHLFGRFPLRDRRGKQPAPHRPFKIDDRDRSDTYTGTWFISAQVPDMDNGAFFLSIDGAPHNAEVEDLVQTHGGRKIDHGTHVRLLLPIRPRDGRFLRKLARAIRKVVADGQKYSEPNWKWIAPRTADCLKALGDHLDAFRPPKAIPPQPAPSSPGGKKGQGNKEKHP